jgi:hypothetical protein
MDGWSLSVRLAFIGLPFVSILAHLCGASWVYDAGFRAANVAPVLLGMAIAAPRVLGMAAGEPVRLTLPVVAVIVSSLSVPPGGGGWVNLNAYPPLHLAIVSAGLVYLWHAWEYRRPTLAVLVAMAAVIYLLGRVPRAVWRAIERFVVNLASWTGSLLPRTALQWGMLTLFGAFALLGIGLIVSLKKPALHAAPVWNPPADE